MTHLAQVLMTVLALVIWLIALVVFLTGFTMLAKQDISLAESIAAIVFFSAISIGLFYGGWRLIKWARCMSHC
jgi:hypothetical protein